MKKILFTHHASRSTHRLFCLFFATFLLATSTTHCSHPKPRLTVIFVVDQLAYQTLEKLQPYLKFGIGELMRRGINYLNAYHPYGEPETAVGHAGMSTGTYAKDHGIIRNDWFDSASGKLVGCDDDTSERAAVLSPTGTYSYGKSPHNIMVDGISDQFVLNSRPGEPYHSVAISFKSRAAICSANRLGKAIWFDTESGNFTSSKAYFDTLPEWLTAFNKKKAVNEITGFTWELARHKSKRAYSFHNLDNYEHTQTVSDGTTIYEDGIIGKHIPIDREKNPKNPYNIFIKTPHANKLLLDLAQACIDEFIAKDRESHLLLWISLSSLDKLGHALGQESREAIDMIYHLDEQIKQFMRNIEGKTKKKETLWVFTSDHGISPIPEQMKMCGLPAGRIDQRTIIKKLNKHIQNATGIVNGVHGFTGPQFYFNEQKMQFLTPDKYQLAMQETKNFLMTQPGIKQAWTYNELQNSAFAPDQLENYFKQQLFPGRSGGITVQLYPYFQITDYKGGADHCTPYEQNTHVPLIIYQSGELELKKISNKVYLPQLANTLAEILGIQKPSASTFEQLPGLATELGSSMY
jgi:predicted AlkP superfamily pyrophosphatase or phosphodiesterase